MRPYRRSRLSERDLEEIDLSLFYSLPRGLPDRLPTRYWLRHQRHVEELMVQFASRTMRRVLKPSNN